MPRERKEETMNAAWLDAAFAPVCENSYRTAVRVAKRAMSAPSRSPPLPQSLRGQWRPRSKFSARRMLSI
jgi:hypothetical protein